MIDLLASLSRRLRLAALAALGVLAVKIAASALAAPVAPHQALASAPIQTMPEARGPHLVDGL